MTEDVIEEVVPPTETEEAAIETVSQPAVEAAPEKVEEVEKKPEPEQEPELKDKTNKRIRALLAERDEWKRRAMEAGQKTTAQAPTLEQFDHDIEKFTEASIDHRANAHDAKRANEQVEQIAAATQAEMVETFKRDVEAKRTIYPDFDQVFHPALPVTPQLAEIVVTSEDPTGVAYYLGKHPDVLSRLNNMPASAQGYEIAKIESMVSARTIPTKAPAPMQAKVVPTGGSGKKSYDDMSDAEFAAARAKERANWRATHGY